MTALQAAQRHDGAFNRWFPDPVFKGSFPQDRLEWYGKMAPSVGAHDLKTIAALIDLLGVNYCTRRTIPHGPRGEFIKVRRIWCQFVPHTNFERWEVNPEALYLLLRRVHREYGQPVTHITESGTPLDEQAREDGTVADLLRLDYLRRHLAAAWHAIQEGVRLRGYFVWSLLDDFEWYSGCGKRFGLVHVDYAAQKRTVKESGRWFAETFRRNWAVVQFSGPPAHLRVASARHGGRLRPQRTRSTPQIP